MRGFRTGFSVRRLLLAAVAAASVTTACTPAAAVPGNPSDYSVNVFSGWVERWNPCATVTYKADVRLNPDALANVKAAVAQLSNATGIPFVFGGTTAFTPSSSNWNAQPAPLVIAFAHNGHVYGGSSYLAGGNQLGEGGFQMSYYTQNGRVTSVKITKGYAVIDSDGYNRQSGKVRMAALLHELGHAVGLNHAHFASEVMYPIVSDGGAGSYAAGDLAGLAKVGRSAGCLA